MNLLWFNYLAENGFSEMTIKGLNKIFKPFFERTMYDLFNKHRFYDLKLYLQGAYLRQNFEIEFNLKYVFFHLMDYLYKKFNPKKWSYKELKTWLSNYLELCYQNESFDCPIKYLGCPNFENKTYPETSTCCGNCKNFDFLPTDKQCHFGLECLKSGKHSPKYFELLVYEYIHYKLLE